MTDDHFDQIAPVDGVQLRPDGTLAPVEIQPPGMPDHLRAQAPVSAELEDAIRRQIESQREQLAQPAGNIGTDGAPHFLRMVDGTEVCGQDGKPWPCDQAQGIAATLHTAEYGEVPLVGLDEATPTFAQTAAALGLTETELMAKVDPFRRP